MSVAILVRPCLEHRDRRPGRPGTALAHVLHHFGRALREMLHHFPPNAGGETDAVVTSQHG